ncbi:CRISPR-associated endonuclease Cas2 [Methylacidimicrobium tartarophylax]|nr:CRISPR-associated endonuclease Cas2 [Methylacidimicrobium tartarophylax]
MLSIIAYDIADQRRLARVGRICEDYGMRVQYSVFECYLEPEQLDELWGKLQDELDFEEDRIVAYTLDAKCAKKIRTGGTMVCSERVVCYLV